MSDQPKPGRTPDLPPDLPPEYAETYRRAYEAAYRDLQRGGDEPPADPPADQPSDQSFEPSFDPSLDQEQRFAVSGPLFADEDPSGREPTPGPGAHAAEPTRALPGLAILEQAQAHQEEAEHAGRSDERPAWLVPGLLALAVVLLLAAAFGIGKVVSHSVSGTQEAAGGGAATGVGPGGGAGGGPGSGTDGGSGGGTHEAHGKPYDGAVQAVPVRGASASCQAPRSVDAAGHPIGYPASNAVDGDLTTAWRCDGDGVGEKLELDLAGGTRIAEVGLVPGYAKTDPRSGADRYAQNDRITKVRWVFSDGTTVTQTFDGSAKRRDLQTQRIPVVRADRVTVEILASTPGPRHTVAVSEVHLAGPAG